MALGDSKTFPAKTFEIGGTDLSNALVSCQITQASQLSPSVFTAGDDWQKGNEPTSKKSFVCQVELLLGEFGTGSVHALMSAGQAALQTFKVSASSEDTSATNPEWTFKAAVPEMMPFGGGGLSDNVMQSFTLTAVGSVTEATS